MKKFWVYIITNKTNSTLYIGITSNLQRRIHEHKNGLIEGFSKKYNLKKLVYVEEISDAQSAIAREKQLKRWSRKLKDNLINSINPEWKDLLEE